MDLSIPTGFAAELPAALLQTVVTGALALLLWSAYQRLGKAYLRWWCLTWTLYVIRMGAILAFAWTEWTGWLFWHQVLTGWTALGLVGAAFAFSRPHRSLRWLGGLALFPPLWSWVAIYQMDEFLLAAAPAVLFLSLATLLAAAVFVAHNRKVGSPAALFLGIVLGLWALHHLDYPFLRARGAWAPWGYYLDILFEGAVGFGIFILMLEDLRSGLHTLSALSSRVHRRVTGSRLVRSLLDEVETLPGVEGTALIDATGSAPCVLASTGGLLEWGEAPLDEDLADHLHRVGARTDGGVVRLSGGDSAGNKKMVGTTWIPVRRPDGGRLGLVVSGAARHGLAALDDRYLLAIGDQIGLALEEADLRDRLLARTEELEALSALTVRQHEAERQHLSRELHDETAQALAGVRVRLALLREEVGKEALPSLDLVEASLGQAITSIRRVTASLRPPVLDELGLLPALRALVRDFSDDGHLVVDLAAAPLDKPLSGDQELTLFRGLQEGLANVVRHARATRADVELKQEAGSTVLTVTDNGRGLVRPGAEEGKGKTGGMGLVGMRERVGALGGSVELFESEGRTHLCIVLPTTLGRSGSRAGESPEGHTDPGGPFAAEGDLDGS